MHSEEPGLQSKIFIAFCTLTLGEEAKYQQEYLKNVTVPNETQWVEKCGLRRKKSHKLTLSIWINMD